MIVDDDDDRRSFMKEFTDAVQDYGVRVYSCCLMGNHYHALLDTPRGNLSEFAQALNSEYSKRFNRRHERVGHTFEQRFGSTVVQREKYLRRVVRYIALNPVKAGLRRDAADWEWSTHRATAGLEPPPPWLHLEWLRWAFRADTLADGQRRYLEYVRDPSGLTWSFDLTTMLGTPRYQRAVGRLLEAVEKDDCIPIGCRRTWRPPLAQIFANEEADIHSRDALILEARLTHGYGVAEIGRFLGMDPSAICKALRRTRGRV